MLIVSRLPFLVGVILAAALAPAIYAAPPTSRFTPQELKQGFANGHLLAKPKASIKDGDLSAQESRLGIKLRRQIKGHNTVRLLEFSSINNVRQTAAQLRASGLYEYVEPDFIRRAQVLPNDPQFGTQWSLANSGQNGGTPSADIAAVPAWDKRHDAPNVIVAIIDSGLRPTHEDLAGNLWTNSRESNNGVDDDSSGYLDDVHGINTLVPKGTAGDGDISDNEGHGTAVASVIGAVGNNGKGISGVAWKVQLMPLKFNDATEMALSSNEIICINYAIAHGAKIINFSYGANGYSQSEYDAIKAARDAGVIFVCAAGNEGFPMELAGVYPAGYLLDNIVTVGNTDRNDQLDSSSNFGGVVDLGAPGTDIRVCTKDGDSTYDTLTGTSFSSPAVAGALALVAAQFPSDNYRQLINRVLNSVTLLDSLTGGAGVSTGGRLNLNQALASANNRPINDNFANASEFSPYWGFVRASSKGATVESSEPNHGSSGGASLWWKWTAQSSGTAKVDTTGSDFATSIGVFTGTQLNKLTQVASNTGSSASQPATVTFSATQGTTYYITVDGKNGASGEIALAVDLMPSNDAFATPYVMTSGFLDSYVADSNRFATKESIEPVSTSDGYTGSGHSLWYAWQSNSSTSYRATATVFSERFDSIVSVYTGSSISNLSLLQSGIYSASFDAQPNQTYYIQVDSIDDRTGLFVLSMVKADTVDTLATEIYSSPAVDASGNVAIVDAAGVIGYFTPDQGAGTWVDQVVQGTVGLSSPAFDSSGFLYVGASTGFYKIAPDESIVWSKTYPNTSGSSASPAIGNDGTVYVHSDDGTLHAYTSSGVERWAAMVPGSSLSSPSLATNGLIYIGSDDHHLYAINAVDGSLAWKFDAGDSIQASPAIDRSNNVYFGTLGSQFYQVGPNGTQLFSVTLPGEVHSSAALDTNNNATVGSDDGTINLIYQGTGRTTIATADGPIYAGPTLLNNQGSWVGSAGGSVYGAGARTWNTFGAIFGSIAIAPSPTGSVMVFGASDHNVYFVPAQAQLDASSPWPTFRGDMARTGRAQSQLSVPVIHGVTSSQAFAPGSTPVLGVAAEGTEPLSYSWSFNGTPMGVTTGSLVLNNFSSSMAGTYTVTVSNANGSVTSDPIVVTTPPVVTNNAGPGRIINLSARAYTGNDANRLIVGLNVGSGTGTKPILVRGIGPSLGPRGVTTFIDDPALNLYTGSTITSSNDNWATDSAVLTASAMAGAVSFVTDRDSALVAHLSPGGYTAQVVGGSTSNGNGGVALAEFYDISPTIASDTPLLTNISARAYVGQGDQVLIIGFIIGGNSPVKVLIRGLGPELVHQSVPGVLTDPTMRLVNQADGSTLVENDNWGDASNASDIQAAFSQVGAPALDAGSKDAAIMTTLQPGGYTVVISGVNSSTGIALGELFEVP